jgi:hypothetical protein
LGEQNGETHLKDPRLVTQIGVSSFRDPLWGTPLVEHFERPLLIYPHLGTNLADSISGTNSGNRLGAPLGGTPLWDPPLWNPLGDPPLGKRLGNPPGENH